MSFRAAALSLLLAVATLAFHGLTAHAADQLLNGTWEFNAAKSKSTGPLPKSQTRTYERTGLQEKMTAKGIDAQGNATLNQFTAQLDGKDYPYEGGGPDTVAIIPVDALTNNFVLKKAGVVILTGTRTISADGKVLTLAGKGTNPAGQPVESSLVFDKK